MDTPENKKSEQAKNAYHSPVVRYYGALSTITANTGMLQEASSDGSQRGNTKTR